MSCFCCAPRARAGLVLIITMAFWLGAVTAASAITRDEVMARAKVWTDAKVPYTGAVGSYGYRQDCSGYVSYCWRLDPGSNGGPNTVAMGSGSFADEISKDDLKPGDALLKDVDTYTVSPTDRHVVLFGGWTNADKTGYWCYEEGGWLHPGRADVAPMPYPYMTLGSYFRPIRYRFIEDSPGPGPPVGVGYRENGDFDPLIKAAYGRNADGAVLGSPTNPVHQWGPGNNGWIQDFGPDHAITHKTNGPAAVRIHDAIWHLYTSLGGPWSSLGWPWDDRRDLGNGYYVQNFEGQGQPRYDSWISDAPYWGAGTHDCLIWPPDSGVVVTKAGERFGWTMAAGEMQLFQLKIKNYGQQTWQPGQVLVRLKGDSAGQFEAANWSLGPDGEYIVAAVTETVPPQGTTVVSWYMTAPTAQGTYAGLQVMLYSLTVKCYVPNVVIYDITVGPPSGGTGGFRVGYRADGTLDQKFVDCYDRNGGAAVIGTPTSHVEPLGVGSAGWVQHFGPDKAILRKDKSYALAAYTYGAIWHLYTALGGPDGPSYGGLDWPYWKSSKDPYYSNTSYPVQTPPGILDHPFGPVYQSYMAQNFLDTVPYDGWICEAPFWGDKTHDGLIYPFDTYDPVMVAGQTERFRLLVKNYGQETWQPGDVLIRIKGTYAASFRADGWWEPAGEASGTVLIAGSVNEAVPPQGTTVLEWDMRAPLAPGVYGPGDTDLTVMLYGVRAGGAYVPNVMHYHITVVPAAPGPDYVISELRRTDGNGERIQGDTIDLSWETRNQGATAATAVSTTRIHLSGDATIDAADVVLHEDTVPALAAGQSYPGHATVKVSFGILSAGMLDHQFHIGAICDTGDAIAEINEGNNVAGGPRLIVTQGSTYTLTVAAAGGGTVSGLSGASGAATVTAAAASSGGVWQGTYAPGAVATVQAVPAGDSIFLGWKWDQTDSHRQTNVSVTRNMFVTANFAPIVIFSDVALDQWAAKEIASCYYAGLVQGYPDGSYQPGEAVTRDQMAAYISRAVAGGDAKVPSGPAAASFADVPTSYWAFAYVEYAKSRSVATGYPDGLYHPEDAVTRDQMAVYISRAIANPTGDQGLVSYTPPATPSFSDVPAGSWAFRYVEYAKQAGVVQGYPDGLYHPANVVTRDQMAVYVQRAFGLPM